MAAARHRSGLSSIGMKKQGPDGSPSSLGDAGASAPKGNFSGLRGRPVRPGTTRVSMGTAKERESVACSKASRTGGSSALWRFPREEDDLSVAAGGPHAKAVNDPDFA